MYTKADAIPPLDDDSGNLHPSPGQQPPLPPSSSYCQESLAPATLSDIRISLRTLQIPLQGFYSAEFVTPERAQRDQLHILLSLAIETNTTWISTSCPARPAVTATNYNYETCPLRNQGLPLQGTFSTANLSPTTTAAATRQPSQNKLLVQAVISSSM